MAKDFKTQLESYKKQKKYKNDFTKSTYKSISLMLNKTSESDIIKWLDGKENKRAYLIDLIRNDMNKWIVGLNEWTNG